MRRKLQGTLLKSSLAGGALRSLCPAHSPARACPRYDGFSDWLEKANLAVGELNGGVENVPDPNIINYMYIRREAVLSSQIEGTQSTLDDLLRYEPGGAVGSPIDDVAEVSSYVSALNHGLKCFEGGLRVSLCAAGQRAQ